TSRNARVGADLMILQSLAGLPAFLVYFCTAIAAVVAYLFVYTRVTPHNEFDLIRANEPAAAIALGLSLLGFVLPLVSAIAHSAAGQAFGPRCAAADGYVCGRQRRLHADAEQQLRAIAKCGLAVAPARQC